MMIPLLPPSPRQPTTFPPHPTYSAPTPSQKPQQELSPLSAQRPATPSTSSKISGIRAILRSPLPAAFLMLSAGVGLGFAMDRARHEFKALSTAQETDASSSLRPAGQSHEVKHAPLLLVPRPRRLALQPGDLTLMPRIKRVEQDAAGQEVRHV